MKRLRDSEATTPLLQKANALLESAEPLPESDARMQRVRRALDEPAAAPGFFVRMPALASALAIALFGASAFAAVRVYQAVTRPEITRATPPSAAASQKRAAREVPAAEPEVQVVEAQAEAEPVAAEPAPKPAPHVDAKAREGLAAREAQAALVADTELVHRAVKALRRDGDPALAARLLGSRRARGAAGPLDEEALSLQIEAALALRDARAKTFASQYVARYPSGRYLAVAQRALAGAAP